MCLPACCWHSWRRRWPPSLSVVAAMHEFVSVRVGNGTSIGSHSPKLPAALWQVRSLVFLLLSEGRLDCKHDAFECLRHDVDLSCGRLFAAAAAAAATHQIPWGLCCCVLVGGAALSGHACFAGQTHRKTTDGRLCAAAYVHNSQAFTVRKPLVVLHDLWAGVVVLASGLHFSSESRWRLWA